MCKPSRLQSLRTFPGGKRSSLLPLRCSGSLEQLRGLSLRETIISGGLQLLVVGTPSSAPQKGVRQGAGQVRRTADVAQSI